MLGLDMIDTFLIGSRKILKLGFSLVFPTSLMGLGITIEDILPSTSRILS